MNDTKVSTSITLDIRIARWLKEAHYDAEMYADYGQVYIFSRVVSTKTFLWMSRKVEHRMLIGHLYFGLLAAARGVSPSKKWIIDVHGNAYLDSMNELAQKLSKEFKLEVHVCLKTERPRSLPDEVPDVD